MSALNANSKEPTVGIFRTIPVKFVNMERQVAIKQKKSLDGLTAAAFEHFWNRMTASERKAAIESAPAKKMGRKIK